MNNGIQQSVGVFFYYHASYSVIPLVISIDAHLFSWLYNLFKTREVLKRILTCGEHSVKN